MNNSKALDQHQPTDRNESVGQWCTLNFNNSLVKPKWRLARHEQRRASGGNGSIGENKTTFRVRFDVSAQTWPTNAWGQIED